VNLVTLDDALRAQKQAEALEPALPRAVGLGEFLAMDIPRREMALDPVLPAKGLMMVFGGRGMGKTFVALGMAYAIASGGPFLRWRAPKPRRVLLIDGEMAGRDLQERLAAIVEGAEAEPPREEYLRILASDLQDAALPDIANESGQAAYDRIIDDGGADVVLLDNLSTLARRCRENEGDDWTPVADWLLSLRRRGKSVVLIHHAGKGGAQRGTSRREDTLDTVIELKRPEGYDPEAGAEFEVHLSKGRGIHGAAARPFLSRLTTEDGRSVWTVEDIVDAELVAAGDLFGSGLSVRMVAKELGISTSAAGRLRQRWLGSVPPSQG
jgi:putative DNA primase/helicase